jgi:MoaA/NifB/PqqE/SkfB family radical SAM enzyme
MTFCYAPWTNVDISPNGTLSPCCKYQFNSCDKKFNIKYNTIEEYKSSDLLKSIKQSFVNDRWADGCTRCQIEEKNDIKSKRQLDYERWKQYYDICNLTQTGFITASIAFGNTCNLSCITCSPMSSSRWQKEYEVIYNKKVLPFHFYKQNFVNEFVQQATDIVHIDIPGGEPFLSGVTEQKLLLEHYIRAGNANSISLHYTTNATLYPDETWWHLWDHFKEVDIQLSIDGVKKRFEYIRFPADWNTVNVNINKYIQNTHSKLKLSVSHTVSAYNIYYLDEFLTWVTDVGLPRPWQGRVHNPLHMRPSVWHQNARDFIIDHLKNSAYSDCHVWANYLDKCDDSNQFKNFLKYLNKHDQYRNLDFKITFPDLVKFL